MSEGQKPKEGFTLVRVKIVLFWIFNHWTVPGDFEQIDDWEVRSINDSDGLKRRSQDLWFDCFFHNFCGRNEMASV